MTTASNKTSAAVEAGSSYWKRSQPLPRFGRLDHDLDVDVAVIGAGITGITAAYLLARAGRRVALLERGSCAAMDTGCTTAHLTYVTDTRVSELIESLGEDHARAVCDAGLAAIACIDDNVRREAIDCGFAWVPGYLHAPIRLASEADLDAAARDLRREAEAAARLGFDAVFVERVPFVDRPGVEFRDQARFHPRQYLRTLLERVVAEGGQIFEHSAVTDVTGNDRLTVETGGGRVTCADVVVATHNPIVGRSGQVSAAFLQTKLSLYTSYAVAARVPSGRVPDALFWDTDDPYFYLRIDARHGYDEAIFGGCDHKTGQADSTSAQAAQLDARLRSILPEAEITDRWSGQVLEPADGLPLIGEMAPHQYAATGFSGNGMTFGTLGAMMAHDAIVGRANPWRDLFDIHRTTVLGGMWDYVRENADYPYYLVRDRFAGGERRSLRSVPRGQGRVIDWHGQAVAAYRAPDGAVTLRSATCTHLGCLVRWNDAERSWDCPCHGSRFSPSGRVLAGPAESPLAEVPQTPRGE